MATEFQFGGETFFVRWASHHPDGPSYEFGTMTNFEDVCRMMDNGFEFEPVGMPHSTDPVSRQDVERMVATGQATFGDYPVTVGVGTGEMFRFTVES